MPGAVEEELFSPLKRYERIIPGFREFLECLRNPLPKTVRINTLKASVEEVLSGLEERGVEFEPLGWYEHGIKLLNVEKPGNMLEYFLGFIHPQEEVSMIPPLLMELQHGELVLDLCAAPGSKATQISQLMANTGHVVANDVSLSRLSLLRDNYERLGVLNMSVTMYDGRRFPLVCQFDKVLVDAPCSCEGVIRKDFSVLRALGKHAYWRMHKLQRALLLRATRLVKPGGLIVYSTCTFAPEENELVVDYVLKRTRDLLEIEPLELQGLKYAPGLTEWGGRELHPDLVYCARFYPHFNDTGGLFVAKLRRKK
ncbi:RsmB/NOP family class I SAM-dependent RNA methyltransferase [Candidatus Bathyarchaeota archaeon]|nr:MAG: RsmB/NOP family class I SAM-dependent RNA methyltransferase [Candidatus Bathyarchaeota archaeon]